MKPVGQKMKLTGLPSKNSANKASDPHPKPTGLHVAGVVMNALREGDQLLLGASNPVRDAALVGLNTQGIKVRSNRGVAGIDLLNVHYIVAAEVRTRIDRRRALVQAGDVGAELLQRAFEIGE